MTEREHIIDADLLALLDGEVLPQNATRIRAHLDHCEECRARRRTLLQGSTVYAEFHGSVLKPALRADTWAPLAFDASPRQSKVWWPAAAAACVLVAIIFVAIRTNSLSRQTTDLLARATQTSRPAREQIQITFNDKSWLRPAHVQNNIDPKTERVRTLFVRANYDWNNPLSATAFANWRRQLRHHRDHVSTLETSSGASSYLIRTDTSDSSLHSATLRLQGEDLVALQGDFRFEKNEQVEITDAGEATPPAYKNEVIHEGSATAADELRVLAALDRIGADVQDPITVKRNSKAVLVIGIGVRPSRQQEIRSALTTIPRTMINFLSHPHAESVKGSIITANDVNPITRSILESRVGGGEPFESISSRALEISTNLLSQAHALDALALEFPPPIESQLSRSEKLILQNLETSHVDGVDHTAAQLREVLQRLLPSGRPGLTPGDSAMSWQSDAGRLYARAHTLDDELARLLASAYAPDEAQQILIRLADDIERIHESTRNAARH